MEKYTPPIEYKYVDLGLPSGTLWATCNVGVTKPEDYGLYFQWGDTVGYTDASHSTWKTCPYQTVDTTDSSKTKFTKYVGSTTSSYKDPSATNEDATKTVLDLVDDAANVNMGDNWRMPTYEEVKELTANTKVTWYASGNTEFNGVAGRKFVSKTDSRKYIFIPAAGYTKNGNFYGQNKNGSVLTSSLAISSFTPNPWRLEFDSYNNGTNSMERNCGVPIRGVIKP